MVVARNELEMEENVEGERSRCAEYQRLLAILVSLWYFMVLCSAPIILLLLNSHLIFTVHSCATHQKSVWYPKRRSTSIPVFSPYCEKLHPFLFYIFMLSTTCCMISVNTHLFVQVVTVKAAGIIVPMYLLFRITATISNNIKHQHHLVITVASTQHTDRCKFLLTFTFLNSPSRFRLKQTELQLWRWRTNTGCKW